MHYTKKMLAIKNAHNPTLKTHVPYLQHNKTDLCDVFFHK
jgi:hypothetical protein